ncbi:LytTr DNA-binding domain-containing protein [Chitinophaga sp. YR573]|uniref:LytR/AlgR family response regulator transcription factor n=1 Tax=Chitinophaga sp. YR573 TaxID=1881040 RepID=UPI0008CD2108|nr:LytTR family DNA-binding domain-containing protein [Chitinophaga sp. YR573]SEW04586.1 LytTr DNA-binding domain-containing protein [Chitinophaga sp. YR573]
MHEDFFLNTDEGLVKVNSSEIHYIESFGKHSRVITSRGKFDVSFALSRLERDVLPDSIFCRIHRSFIISLSNIRALDIDEVEMHGAIIPIEKTYREKLLRSLNIIW